MEECMQRGYKEESEKAVRRPLEARQELETAYS